MRDILEQLEQLNESTGLAGRKVGDTFKNAEGSILTFQELKFFPEEGKYDPEQLDQALTQITKQAPNIYWQNERSNRTGGFGIASFMDDAGGTVNIGRYVQEVKPSYTDNYISNSFKALDMDWQYGGAAAVKAQSHLTPQDLLTKKIDLTTPEIMKQLAVSLGTDNPLYAVAHHIAMGGSLPYKFKSPNNVSFTAFRDYFCEILQPMALQKGTYEGNAGEAAARFLDGDFSDTVISFDQSKTAGLSDSIMSDSKGRYVKISSKGKKGATASTKNLIDSVNELRQTPVGKKLLNTYKTEIDILQSILDNSQAGGPLALGVEYGIISNKDALMIQDLKSQRNINIKNIDSLGLTPKLTKLALSRDADNPANLNLYYHLTAAVAHKVAEYVNENTNFSKAATNILNNGALVQVLTSASQSKESWSLDSFDTIYPGETIKGVFLDAGKTYYSTGIKGKFTFKIDKGRGVPKDDQPKSQSNISRGKRISDLATAAKQVVAGAVKAKEKGPREKRKK
jgi:hypothetical protein